MYSADFVQVSNQAGLKEVELIYSTAPLSWITQQWNADRKDLTGG
jgi:hypothetical protein